MTRGEKTKAIEDVLEKRGYAVIGIRHSDYQPGDLTNFCCGTWFDYQWVITGETDASDWLKQAEMIVELSPELKFDVSKLVFGPAYYRAVPHKADAELLAGDKAVQETVLDSGNGC